MKSSKPDSRHEYEIILRMREFEITQLTQRNNFFMIFQGVMLSGVIQSIHSKPIISFLVCTAGFVISLFQVGMAAGAKFWQEYWEAELTRSQPILFHQNNQNYIDTVKGRLKERGVGNNIEKLVMRRYSVSRIPIWVGLFLSIFWLALTLCTFREYRSSTILSFISGF